MWPLTRAHKTNQIKPPLQSYYMDNNKILGYLLTLKISNIKYTEDAAIAKHVSGENMTCVAKNREFCWYYPSFRKCFTETVFFNFNKGINFH